MLIHSVDGVHRACCACVAFYMFRYHWNLDKALDFVQSKPPTTLTPHRRAHRILKRKAPAACYPLLRASAGSHANSTTLTGKRPDLEPRPSFMRHLFQLDQRLQRLFRESNPQASRSLNSQGGGRELFDDQVSPKH